MLNHKNMVNEEQTLNAFIIKQHLKKTFLNEEFSLLLTSLGDEQVSQAHVYVKKIVQEAAAEDGEIV